MQDIDFLLRIIQPGLHFDYVQSSGPGGQNVNKVATAVQLRFNVRDSSLPKGIKERLTVIMGKRITTEGLLIIEAKRFRTRDLNRRDVMERFTALLKRSMKEPKRHVTTKPTGISKEKRLKSKKRKSEIKRNRRGLFLD